MKLLYKNYIYESSDIDEDDEDNDEYTEIEDTDEYQIEKIVRDGVHKFTSFGGVNYRLSFNGKHFSLDVSRIEETPENTFYEDQIKKYEKYISEGGIIDVFPVQGSPLAYNLEEMCQFISANSYNTPYTDDIDDMLEGTLFDRNGVYLEDITIENTEPDEKYYKYRRLNPLARDVNRMFPAEDRTEDELELIKFFEIVFKFFDDNKEYTLVNMNHRFNAIKRLGITTVLVEEF